MQVGARDRMYVFLGFIWKRNEGICQNILEKIILDVIDF